MILGRRRWSGQRLLTPNFSPAQAVTALGLLVKTRANNEVLLSQTQVLRHLVQCLDPQSYAEPEAISRPAMLEVQRCALMVRALASSSRISTHGCH